MRFAGAAWELRTWATTSGARPPSTTLPRQAYVHGLAWLAGIRLGAAVKALDVRVTVHCTAWAAGAAQRAARHGSRDARARQPGVLCGKYAGGGQYALDCRLGADRQAGRHKECMEAPAAAARPHLCRSAAGAAAAAVAAAGAAALVVVRAAGRAAASWLHQSRAATGQCS